MENYGGAGYGALTLEQATINSVNTVYAQLIMDVGPANVVRTAHAMGLTSYLRPYPSAVLGTNEVNTLEMASAYGTLATMGTHVPPIAVTRITDAQGRVIYQSRVRPQQVIDPNVAWTTDQILQKVVQVGTARAANIDRPAAGKTGTAQDYTNAWFVGFVPQLVAGVWMGFPRRGDIPMVYPRVRLPYVTGGSWPAQIWRAFMVNATKDLPPLGFPQPQAAAGAITLRVDVRRNCLPNPWTLPTDVALVRYVDGQQPTKVCAEPSGPQMVGVPEVVGMGKEAAVSTLQSWGFQVAVSTRPDGAVPRDTVLEQDPAGGARRLQGTTVSIVVSEEPDNVVIATIPNTVGLSSEDAITLLTAVGFTVSVIDQWQCQPPSACGAVRDQVWHQDPPSGTSAYVGTLVQIWVNRDEASPPPSPSPTPSASPTPSPGPTTSPSP